MNSNKKKMEELKDVKIISKNIISIIGLSSSLANEDKLKKYEYLGQYGTILKILINNKP